MGLRFSNRWPREARGKLSKTEKKALKLMSNFTVFLFYLDCVIAQLIEILVDHA